MQASSVVPATPKMAAVDIAADDHYANPRTTEAAARAKWLREDAVEAATTDADAQGTMLFEAAQRSSVRYVPSLLDGDDIAAVFALGAEMSDELRWINLDHSSAVTYLHRGDMFGQRCPTVKEKLRAAALAAERAMYGTTKRRKLTFRCVELHRSTTNGGLPEKEHYDRGSVVTVDVRLSPGGAFTGGEFRTVEADEAVRGHGAFFARPGDAMAFCSHKRHHVAPVETGERFVLVAEFWTGEARVCGHRCTLRRGFCDRVLLRADEVKTVVTDAFFEFLDADALEALQLLDGDDPPESCE